jgi:uncharacterized repeat protein (TIGR01451 family)
MNSKRLAWIVGLVLVLLAFPANVATDNADASKGAPMFVENVGQLDAPIRFQVQSAEAAVWLTEDGVWLTQDDDERIALIKISFPAGSTAPLRLEPFDRQETVLNYFRGRDSADWHANVPVWGGVRYVDLYPGVDLEVTGERGQLAWGLVCRSNCPPDLVELTLRVEGADRVTQTEGALHLDTAVGTLKLPLLSVQRPVEGRPEIVETADGGYDVHAPFAADALSVAAAAPQGAPGGLLASTFIGGDDQDGVKAVTLDADGSVYVTGYTGSTDIYWPQAPGVHALADVSPQGAHTGPVFVAKFSADLSTRNYMTFLGSEYQSYSSGISEYGFDIAVDDAGNAYVTGQTTSLDEFPVTAGAFDTTLNDGVDENCSTGLTQRPCPDAFVAKLNGSGSLTYASYLGGSYVYAPGQSENIGGNDRGVAIGVDSNHHVYVVGETNSQDFPTTQNAYDREFSYVDIGLNPDVFVVKLNPAGAGGTDLLYGTYVGAGFVNSVGDAVVDEAGVVHVTGSVQGRSTIVNGPKIDFPTTSGAYPRASHCLAYNCRDIFFFKLSPGGQGRADLRYGTFFGGTAPDTTYAEVENGLGIALDAAGAVYLVGETETPDYPTTAGAYLSDFPGGFTAAMVSKLDPAGNGVHDLVYSTYLGGTGFYDEGRAVTVDANGHAYVLGETTSDDFPLTPDAYDTMRGNSREAFVARLDPETSGTDALVYSTFFGGSGTEFSEDILLTAEEIVYLVGATNSAADFPLSADAYDTSFGGLYDGFVAKLNTAPPRPDLSPSNKSVTPTAAAAGDIVTYTVRLSNSGTLSATVAVTDILPAALIPVGTPTSSSGQWPCFDGQTLTWMGTVLTDTHVTLTYTAELTSTTTLTPTVRNTAQIDDGVGAVHERSAFVNWEHAFLPLILRD